VSDPSRRRMVSLPTSSAAAFLTMVVVVAWCAGPACGQKVPKAGKSLGPVLEENILRYTNQERRSQGLPGLHGSPALRFVARKHSKDMCRTQTFRHESNSFSKGWETFPERLRQVGLRAGGENIGYRTLAEDPNTWAKKVVRGWMESPSHRRNILNPKFHYLGVGISGCKDKIGYATQVFSPDQGKVP
jgi:uncharacterized protein YkwD